VEREGSGGAADFGQGFDETFDDCGDRDALPGCPGTRMAVRAFRDGYVESGHGGSFPADSGQ
jgi:hypothetical protein